MGLPGHPGGGPNYFALDPTFLFTPFFPSATLVWYQPVKGLPTMTFPEFLVYVDYTIVALLVVGLFAAVIADA